MEELVDPLFTVAAAGPMDVDILMVILVNASVVIYTQEGEACIWLQGPSEMGWVGRPLFHEHLVMRQ